MYDESKREDIFEHTRGSLLLVVWEVGVLFSNGKFNYTYMSIPVSRSEMPSWIVLSRTKVLWYFIYNINTHFYF